MIVLLVWVNYASLILLFGAEVTQAYAEHRGVRIEPDEHAVRLIPMPPVEVTQSPAH